MMLSLDTAYRSFGGEVEASSTPTICRLPDSRRHQLWAIASRRRSAIQELYTEDCVLYVPRGTFVGHDALDKFAGDLRATHPHYVYTPHGSPQVLHNSGRLAWGSGPKGETPAYTGVDFIIARDGKIAALYVYLDSPPT